MENVFETYRSKPTTVKAYQVNKEMIQEHLFNHVPLPVGLNTIHASYNKDLKVVTHWKGTVTTIHGQATDVALNDYVVMEPDEKHFYPCKPDIFEKKYEHDS